MYKVALIDPRLLTRVSVSHLLEAEMLQKRRLEDFEILPFADANELLLDVAEHRDQLKLIILNIGANCASDNREREEIHQLKQELPEILLTLISERDEAFCILEALRQGAHSYIPTTLDPAAVIKALRVILAGGMFIPVNTLSRIFDKVLDAATLQQKNESLKNKAAETALYGLTPRQREVLHLLREGKPNKIIAYKLNMQESTVKVHVRHIMRKLKATNRAHVVFLTSHGRQETGPS